MMYITRGWVSNYIIYLSIIFRVFSKKFTNTKQYLKFNLVVIIKDLFTEFEINI